MQERIFLSSERLNQLIHDMLTAMDLEGGVFHFRFERINIAEIIGAIYEELNDNFTKKQLTFRFIPSQDSFFLMADPRYLREALKRRM